MGHPGPVCLRVMREGASPTPHPHTPTHTLGPPRLPGLFKVAQTLSSLSMFFVFMKQPPLQARQDGVGVA